MVKLRYGDVHTLERAHVYTIFPLSGRSSSRYFEERLVVVV